MIELGVDTFGDRTVGDDGQLRSHAEVIREVIEQAVRADELGLDAFGVGEHHRDDFAIAAPEVVLAAIAGRTTRIRLGSAATVLGTDDPVRVFQRFSTLDAISNGRAEVMLGRGTYLEAFALFGFDVADYERLFDEKLALFAAVRAGAPVTWSGATRAPLVEQAIVPPLERGLLRTWVAAGGTPASVERAARYGLPLVLALGGGSNARLAPLVERYRRTLAEGGGEAQPVGVHAPGHVAATDEQARDELWPYFLFHRTRLAAERGGAVPTREQFERDAGPDGALFVGAPATIADKIVRLARALGLARFDLRYAIGPMPHWMLLRSLELFATDVAPRVRAALATSPTA